MDVPHDQADDGADAHLRRRVPERVPQRPRFARRVRRGKLHDHLVQHLRLPPRVQPHARRVVHDDERKHETHREYRRVERLLQPDAGGQADDERGVRRGHAAATHQPAVIQLTRRVPAERIVRGRGAGCQRESGGKSLGGS